MTNAKKHRIIVSNDTVFEVKMKKKEFSFLTDTFLFSNLSEEEIHSLPIEIEIENVLCEKGRHMDIALSEEKKIAFVLTGECDVMHERLVLNTLKKGDSFGILSIFSNEPYPTTIIAKKQSHILFLKKDTLLALIECSPKIAMNVISFLSGRLTFLNRKVATLGGASVEDKCRSYLKDQYHKHGAYISLSISSVARKIGVGRASLYRALDTMKEKGVLTYEESLVSILRPDLLESK